MSLRRARLTNKVSYTINANQPERTSRKVLEGDWLMINRKGGQDYCRPIPEPVSPSSIQIFCMGFVSQWWFLNTNTTKTILGNIPSSYCPFTLYKDVSSKKGNTANILYRYCTFTLCISRKKTLLKSFSVVIVPSRYI